MSKSQYHGATLHWAEHLTLSEHGATFIATEEGVRIHPYPDSLGWATSGVGHLIQPAHHGVTALDIKNWTFPSEHAAIEYFRKHDVLTYVHAVRQALGKAAVTQAMFDMCVSLAFNIGIAGFARSRVAYFIKRGNYRLAALAFYGWANPRVLWGRRNRESRQFIKGRY